VEHKIGNYLGEFVDTLVKNFVAFAHYPAWTTGSGTVVRIDRSSIPLWMGGVPGGG
jgi:hypothetical protein